MIGKRIILAISILISMYIGQSAHAGTCQDGGMLFKYDTSTSPPQLTDVYFVDKDCKPIDGKACKAGAGSKSICKKGSRHTWGKGILHFAKDREGEQEDESQGGLTGAGDPDAPPGCCVWTQFGNKYYCWKWVAPPTYTCN